MHVGLNAQLLSLSKGYRAAGINWYIYNLLAHLPPHHRYTAFLGEGKAEGLFPQVRLRFAPSLTKNPAVRILWEQTILPWRLAQEGVDLLHSLAFVQPFFCPCPGVVTIYDLSFILFPEGFNPWRRLYLRYMTPHTARKAEYIIALSENTKRDLVRLFQLPEEKVVVIPCGVDPRFRPLQDPTLLADFRRRRGLPERMILFVGTLEPRKNVGLILEAYLRVKEKIPHRLVVVGAKGWRGEKLLAQAEGLDVLFPGYVEQEELPLWYNAADLFVYPSLYEGFGLPPLEAMACGTPVIASSSSSLPEVVGEAGILLEPGDVEGWAEAILTLVGDAQLRAQMRQKGVERAKAFSWQKTAKETVRVYERAKESV